MIDRLIDRYKQAQIGRYEKIQTGRKIEKGDSEDRFRKRSENTLMEDERNEEKVNKCMPNEINNLLYSLKKQQRRM